MRILYGIQTTGNGHLSRASLLIKYLKQDGHDIDVILSGAGASKMWDLSEFEPYYCYDGLTFATKNGGIDYIKTAKQLNIRQFYSDIKNHPKNQYDLVISDFEPISTRIAKQRQIASFGISHQAAFLTKIPKANNPLGALITQHFAKTDYSLGVHWHHFNQPILPPIIETKISLAPSEIHSDKILVYMPYENQQKLAGVLQQFTAYRFHIYGNVDKKTQQKNLFWHPMSRHDFIKDLCTCAGVMSQGGFELASEALHIGKKILMKPISGQYEQLSNAQAMKQIQKGHIMYKLNAPIIEKWLASEAIKAMHYPDVAKALSNFFKQHGNSAGNTEISKLCTSLWSATQFDSMEHIYARHSF